MHQSRPPSQLSPLAPRSNSHHSAPLLSSLLATLALCMTPACAADDDAPPAASTLCDDGEPGPVYTDLSGFDTCLQCHSMELQSPARRGAPPNINFDDYQTTVQNLDRALQQIRLGTMPPAGVSPPLSAVQIAQIERWAECGAPQ